MSAANRRRGHDCERTVCSWLHRNGFPDACTTRAKLGHDGAHAPGDIDFHPLIVLEVKDVKGSAWPTWCRQAAAEAPPGTIPVVVRRTRGVTDVGAWECRYDWAEWCAVIGPPMPGLVPRGITEWARLPFADLVSAVRQLDTEGAA